MKRVFHRFEKWECYKNGFYNTSFPDGMTKEDAMEIYKDFLGNVIEFENAIIRVFNEWKYSCEHFLTNTSINRIAWLGQASVCISKKIPSIARGGFKLLSEEKQHEANELAAKKIKEWERNEKENLSIYI